jgi:hypothetical protein
MATLRISSFNEIDIKQLGKELLNKKFLYDLQPNVQKESTYFDFFQTNIKSNKVEIVVFITRHKFDLKYLDEFKSKYLKIIDEFLPEKIILLNFEFLPYDFSDKLTEKINATYSLPFTSLEFLDVDWVQSTLNQNPEIKLEDYRIISDTQNETSENSKNQYWWLNFSDKTWNFDDSTVNEARLYVGLNKKDNDKIKTNFYNINVGDRVIGYQIEDFERTSFILEITEKADIRFLPRIELKIIQKIPIENQVSFAELNDLNYFKNSEVAKNNNQGSIFHLTEYEYMGIISLISLTTVDKSQEPIKNRVTKTGLDNDGAYTTEDLLEIENDVRSFALILASKNIKPPIAVALFGKWGSGKSFFMEHLSKRVSELSINQGFLEEGETSTEQEKNKEEAFCKGIVQIKFNA